MGNANSGSLDKNSVNFDKNELKILYNNFKKLDTDATGYLEPNEFFDIPQLKDNPIVQRIIKVFDSNQDGKISFFEFVCGLSNLTNSGKKIF
jgi:serine/threonine-protein phosphatase 2B regulatory subunit